LLIFERCDAPAFVSRLLLAFDGADCVPPS
jgi:hypothetical protein